jgi:hypothetical protein
MQQGACAKLEAGRYIYMYSGNIVELGRLSWLITFWGLAGYTSRLSISVQSTAYSHIGALQYHAHPYRLSTYDIIQLSVTLKPRVFSY